MARSSWPEHRRIVTVRRQWPVANALVHAIERFRIHRTGRNSALVAHYAFLSVFPLIAVFTTILGFVLQDNTELQQKIIDSVLGDTIIGQTISYDPASISGSVPVLVVALLTTLWAGLRAFNVTQLTLDDIADVPLDERPNVMIVRVRSLLGILIVGGGQVGAAILTGLTGVSGVDWLSRVMLFLAAFAVNVAVLAATYRYLCCRRPSWRSVMPGAGAAGFAFAVLQVLGTTLVTRFVAKASPIYGTFAIVIGLITWMSMHAMALLLGAELNGVLPLSRLDLPDEPD
jgi:YihY family inner membrane protein